MKLLHVDSSITGEGSGTRLLTARIVDRWRSALPGLEVRHLDLATSPLPHLGASASVAADADKADFDARILEDFLEAEVVVLGAPMYNFTIPSQLKAWIDRIVVAGKTFHYTANGPEGLVQGKKVMVAVAYGGFYAPDSPGEHVESYLRHLFEFVGISDLTFIRAQGLKVSPEHREEALVAAQAAIPLPRISEAVGAAGHERT